MPTLIVNPARAPRGESGRRAGLLVGRPRWPGLWRRPRRTASGRCPARTTAATRYSGLAQITPANAKQAAAGVDLLDRRPRGPRGAAARGQEHDVRGHAVPNVLYAFDLTQEGYPLKWKYRPAVSPNAIGDRLLRRDQPRRVLRRRQDHLQPARRTHGRGRRRDRARSCGRPQIADLGEGETTPMAPFVVKDRVIVGASGGEFGIYGWLEGARPQDRQDRLDRRATSAPTPTCCVKPGTFKPFYDKGADLGHVDLAGGRAGRPAALRSGAGCPTTRSSTWCTTASAIRRPTTPSSVRATTSGPQRAGAPALATARWCGPISSRPHDNWDYDADVDDDPGRSHDRRASRGRCWCTFNKNGFQYTLDRATGEVLAAPSPTCRSTGPSASTSRPAGRCWTPPSRPAPPRAT